MKTAILGGSFNPIHNGHIALAEDVIKIGYDKIFFIPANHPPHKDLIDGSSDKDRVMMLKLALKDFQWAEIWDGEIRRGGTSYSIDTIRELMTSGIIDSRIALIIGDDLARGFSSWRKVNELVSEVDIILAKRIPGPPVDFPFRSIRLDNQIWPYSSTQVRQQIADGFDLNQLVPAAVADYIYRNKLYADAKT